MYRNFTIRRSPEAPHLYKGVSANPRSESSDLSLPPAAKPRNPPCAACGPPSAPPCARPSSWRVGRTTHRLANSAGRGPAGAKKWLEIFFSLSHQKKLLQLGWKQPTDHANFRSIDQWCGQPKMPWKPFWNSLYLYHPSKYIKTWCFAFWGMV